MMSRFARRTLSSLVGLVLTLVPLVDPDVDQLVTGIGTVKLTMLYRYFPDQYLNVVVRTSPQGHLISTDL